MGGTKYVYEVVRRLNAKFKLVVIVENASDLAINNYAKAGIKLISLHKATSTSPWYWLTFPFQLIDTLWRTRQYLKLDPAPKLLLSSMFPMNFVASRMTLPHIQLCFEPFAFFHDPDFVQGFPPIKRLLISLLRTFYRSLDLHATKRSSSIVTLNQVTQRVIKAVYDQDATPIYTGIDTTHFMPHISPELKRKYVKYKVIIHSTDYTPVKGTDQMLRLYAKIKKQVPSSRLLITSTIPDSSAKEPLQNLANSLGISDSVEFLGFVDYDILPQLYSLAKVLVQCSYSERSGTTSMALPVKEALACGTPCIRAPLTTEDVVDGSTGYLVDPRNEQEMIHYTLKLLNLPPQKRLILAKRARASIVKRYTWDRTVASLTGIIKKYGHD